MSSVVTSYGFLNTLVCANVEAWALSYRIVLVLLHWKSLYRLYACNARRYEVVQVICREDGAHGAQPGKSVAIKRGGVWAAGGEDMSRSQCASAMANNERLEKIVRMSRWTLRRKEKACFWWWTPLLSATNISQQQKCALLPRGVPRPMPHAAHVLPHFDIAPAPPALAFQPQDE